MREELTAHNIETLTKPSVYRHRLRVRFSECDPQGVVFNANYLTYFDVAITEFLREAIGRYSDIQAMGVEMLVGEARARFHVPARFDDEIDVEVDPTRVGNTSVTFGFRVMRDGALLVEGELRYVFVDAHTNRKCPIPDEIRTSLGATG